MQKNKLLSLLGMAKRAGALSMGHDAAVNSVFSKKAAVLVLAADISERSKRDMRITAQKNFADLPVAEPDITIDEIYSACGYKAGILTVNNAEMGKRIVTLINE